MRRAGRYRHIKPLPGPPIQNHVEWVCTGCGMIEWMTENHSKKHHCWNGTWQTLTHLAELGIEKEVVQATHAIGGAEAVYELIAVAQLRYLDQLIASAREGYEAPPVVSTDDRGERGLRGQDQALSGGEDPGAGGR